MSCNLSFIFNRPIISKTLTICTTALWDVLVCSVLLFFVNYKKGCTRLAAASDQVYQLLAHSRWFSPCTLASSTNKTGRHDIAEVLLKVTLNDMLLYMVVHLEIGLYMILKRFTKYRTRGSTGNKWSFMHCLGTIKFEDSKKKKWSFITSWASCSVFCKSF
jgi:hypothetical protein